MHTLIIDCLRHGECEGESCLRGHIDVALNEIGWRNMQASARCLPKPQILMSSPLVRCARMAQTLATEWDIACEFNNDLREMNFGDWDGVPLAQLSQQHPEALAAFWADPAAAPPPNAETLAAFEARIGRAWMHLVERDSGHIVVIAHAGVIKTWLAWATGMSTHKAQHLHRIYMPYAGLTRFRIDSDEQGQRWSQLLFHGAPGALLNLPGNQ